MRTGGLGCGDTRARPRRYTGLVAGWSTAGAPKTGLGGRVVAILGLDLGDTQVWFVVEYPTGSIARIRSSPV